MPYRCLPERIERAHPLHCPSHYLTDPPMFRLPSRPPSSTARRRDCRTARAAGRNCISSPPPHAAPHSPAPGIPRRLFESRASSPPARRGWRRARRGAGAAARPRPAPSACGWLWRFRAVRAAFAVRRFRCAAAEVSLACPLQRAAARSLEGDIDGAQPAVGAIDLEADGPALEKRAGIRRQVGAMHEHIARAVVAGEKAVAFGVVEKFYLAGDAHGSSSDALMKPARMRARPPGVKASRAGAASRVVREFAVD